MATIRVSEPYAPLYNQEDHIILCNTPRASGKTYEITQFGAVQKLKYPKHDIIYCRANYNSLGDSLVTEIEEKFDIMGYSDYIKTYKAPLRMEANDESLIYFKGISGSDKSRVRGFKPKHKLSAIIMDECQQISSLENLKHALATFRRYLDTSIDYKIILCGNPHEVKGHWWNIYCQQYEKVYRSIKATYKDIASLLNDDILEDIELEKEINPALYRFMYLGDISDLSGGAYPSFNRDKNVITAEEAKRIFAGEFIEAIIWGGDGAITHDMTAIVPIAVMSSGRACVLERFIFDPIRNGRALAPSELAELIERYVDDMENRYHFIDNDVPSYFIVDCASEDLITQLRYTLSDYHTVKAYTTKNIIRNNSAVNNCFARNMVFIIDYFGYYDYNSNRWIECETAKDPLIEQLESVVWKPGTNKYDPAIPNDVSDALTYGLAVYYENPENLYLPEKLKKYEEVKR